MAAVGQQLAMAAVLNDFTVRHHNDAVCRADGGEAMGNHDARAALQN